MIEREPALQRAELRASVDEQPIDHEADLAIGRPHVAQIDLGVGNNPFADARLQRSCFCEASIVCQVIEIERSCM